MTPAFALVSLLLAGAFEGELQLQLSAGPSSGNIVLTLGQRGLRSDLDSQFLDKTLKSSLIVRADAPDVGLALDPVRRTVQRFSLDEAAEAARPRASQVWHVERLGPERVLEFECEHVRVTSGPDFVAEYWVSREPLVSDALAAIINRASKRPASLEAALRGAGLKGLVLKLEQQTQGQRVSLVLTRATSKVTSPELFEIPAGYRETPGALGRNATLQQVARFNTLSDEQKKALTLELRKNAER